MREKRKQLHRLIDAICDEANQREQIQLIGTLQGFLHGLEEKKNPSNQGG